MPLRPAVASTKAVLSAESKHEALAQPQFATSPSLATLVSFKDLIFNADKQAMSGDASKSTIDDSFESSTSQVARLAAINTVLQTVGLEIDDQGRVEHVHRPPYWSALGALVLLVLYKLIELKWFLVGAIVVGGVGVVPVVCLKVLHAFQSIRIAELTLEVGRIRHSMYGKWAEYSLNPSAIDEAAAVEVLRSPTFALKRESKLREFSISLNAETLEGLKTVEEVETAPRLRIEGRLDRDLSEKSSELRKPFITIRLAVRCGNYHHTVKFYSWTGRLAAFPKLTAAVEKLVASNESMRTS